MSRELDIERYLEMLLGSADAPAMWAVLNDKQQNGMRTWTSSFDAAESRLRRLNEDNHGVFCLVNRSNHAEKRRKENIEQVRAVWVEYDAEGEPSVGLEPSMVVKTRNGWHYYWVLATPSEDVAWGEGMNNTLCRKYGGDPQAKDVARVLRMPGFYHMKQDPRMVKLAEDNNVRYTTQEIEDAFGGPSRPVEAFKSETNAPPPDGGSPWALAAARGEIEQMRGAVKGGRNTALSKGAYRMGQMVGSGELSEGEAWDCARAGARAMGYDEDPTHGSGAADKVIGSAIRQGKLAPRGPKPTGKSPKQAPTGQIVAELLPVVPITEHRDKLLARITDGIDRRIDMGFHPAQSPLPTLDKRLGGGAPAGAVTLLGAPPGMGKSSLALDWAYKYAESGKPAIYLSLELSELDMYARLTTLVRSSEDRRYPWIDVRCGKYKAELLETVQDSLHLPFYTATRHEMQEPGSLRMFLDDLSQKYGAPPLAVIDYLQLMIPSGSEEPRTAMSDISEEVAHCAQDTGSPIICITAINRQSYNVLDKSTGKPDKYLALAAAKESGRLEYDAEVIMGLQLFEMTDEGKQFGWLCIAKNRSGGGTANVGVRYDGMSGRFFDADDDEVYAAMAEEGEGKQKEKTEDVKQKLLDVMAVRDLRDEAHLASAAGVSRNQAKKVLGAMMVAGEILRDFRGNFKPKE